MKIAVALAFSIIFGSFGDILLSVGMKRNGGVTVRCARDVISAIHTTFTSPFVLLGVSAMALHFGSYIAALAWVDVSVANPITALSYLIASVYATAFLREKANAQRWVGILLIMLGATFVGLSS